MKYITVEIAAVAGACAIGVIAGILHSQQPASMLLTVALSVLWIALLAVMSGRAR